MKDKVSYSYLIDMSAQEFIDFCSSKNIGYLKTMYPILCLEFDRVSEVTKGIIPVKEESKENKELYDTLSGVMQVIESRGAYVRGLIKNIESKALN